MSIQIRANRVANRINDDQVPTIQVECTSRKHWKTFTSVLVDGGAGVSVMSQHTKKTVGLTEVK